MTLDSQEVELYPTLPVPQIVKQKYDLIGLLYGIFLGRMIGLVDHYLSSFLKNKFGHMDKSGSCWDVFLKKLRLSCSHARTVLSFIRYFKSGTRLSTIKLR
jgi:hypothetical protein